ncbi:T-lymphoma invasion and metastasis-inducing protein 1-like isoform X1, partial [Clarias magur]
STTPGSEDGGETIVGDGKDDDGLNETEKTCLQRMNDPSSEGGSFKNKKRSKSADMWREDSLEFSLSDLSQEQLTSTEEIVHTTAPEKGKFNKGHEEHAGERTNSLDELCTQKTSTFHGSRNRYKYRRDSKRTGAGKVTNSMLSPEDEEGSGYGAYTLPCRRSHCLSERPPSQQRVLTPSMQGRRAQTSHDITAEDSEYGDSGIDGVTVDAKPQSRRCKAMSASFSVYSAASVRSSSGSSSGGGGDRERRLGEGQGVYENFRQELELSSRQTYESLEEASSAVSDERSSGTASSAFMSEALFLETTQGTVRKAGALAVKNFLVHKKNKKVEPATKRKWKRYWVSLKGCTLFLYETDGRSGIDHNSIPKHAVWAENSIVQAVPEHPKKDFVFCLSNSLGDAFLFQTSGQTELENWITAIHSACATAVARQHHREDTVRFLRAEIKKLEQKIDMDEKMKKMGDMQLSAVNDSKKRKTILDQIFLWEQNLEQFHVDLFRFRCYLSSLQGGELPNPKRLLAFASRPTKLAMGRLGIFSVSSFHALVAARTESGVRRRTHALSRSSSKRKSRFSSLWGLDTTSKKKSKSRPSISQVFVDGEEPVKKSLEEIFGDPTKESLDQRGSMRSLPQHVADSDVWVPEYLTPSWVILPNDQAILVIIQPGETTLEALESVCKANSLDRSRHYLRLKFLIDNQVQFYVPKPEEELWDLLYKEIEICSKTTKVIQFDRNESCTIGYGFSVVVLDEDGTQQLHITTVKAGGMAFTKGLRSGDEILKLNDKEASVLELSDLNAAFAQPSLTLTVSAVPLSEPYQRCPLLPRRSNAQHNLYTDIFSQSQEDILDEASGIVLEGPDTENVEESVLLPVEDPVHVSVAELETDSEHKSTEQMTAFCRSLHDMNPTEPVASSSSSSSSSCAPSPISPVPVPSTQRQLSDADKLRKVINELVDTERTYVKDLHFLIERYLTPLQKENFLSQDELDVLFGNLPEMVEFQVEFLKTLEDGTRLVPDLDKLERVDQFKKVLFSLGGSFLYYADRFKIYSAFCASHTKVPKVLTKAKTDPDFKAFLAKRNPRQQHSSTLESYLIKPIQRVLKYPLLLRELYCLTDTESEEHYHLNVAMKAMNKVASHINEMQKIHEEYGAVFDQLISEQSTDKKEVADLSMGDLLLHATVVWINPPSSLMKGKKDPELAAFVFKTAIVFVYKDCSKQKKKMGTSHRGFVSDERDPFRFRHMIPSDALQVRNTTNSDETAMCEIVHIRSESEGRPERTFHLCCSSSESKRDFLKTVHSVLRDKQRRQLLKTESLPVNQQYVPFGGKRFFALKGVRPMNRA